MNWLNVEIKAQTQRLAGLQALLEGANALHKGEDHQIDTYFQVPNGRLKLRQGNIECALIHYNRNNQEGPKNSHIHYYEPNKAEDLKQALTAALGIKVVVDKRRQIYFLENVKFHLDRVEGLGTFMEIEAIDKDGSFGQAKLLEQCQHYMDWMGVAEKDLIAVSYSDLLLDRQANWPRQ